MQSSHIKFAMLALTLLLLTGCAGKVRYPDYYMLALAPSKDQPINENQQLPAIAVQRFETPGYLRQGRIVYRESPEHIGFYDYHRWALDPGHAVTTAMIDSLRSTGVFSSVAAYDGQEHARYLLHGRLERLDELDYNGGVQVEARLSAQLLDTKTGNVLWTGDTTKTENVDQRRVSSVVHAMGQATQDVVEQLIGDMNKQLLVARVGTVDSAQATGISQPQ